MKWQDSTKVGGIITQKLHRIRNWEFQNMLNGMCTIEMIENLKIENSTKMWVCAISPYERRYDVTEGRPRALGVKRGTATCAITKHAASGPTPACHTAGLARLRTDWEAESTNALFQHNTCVQRDKSWPPTWRRCYGDVTSMHKVYSN